MHQLEIAVGALWRYGRLLRAEGAEIERRMWEQNGIYERQTESETFLEIIDRCGSVPDSKTTEKLQKYEAHLLRVHYRALSELERLQRKHLGDNFQTPRVVEVQNS
jgi:hypothetical protein